MLGRAPVLFTAAVLSVGAAVLSVGVAAADGAAGGALWDSRAGVAPATRAAFVGAPGGACELGRVDRATTPSTRCLACHGGSSARPIDPGLSHPLGMDYASIALRQPDRFVAPAQLPREVPLVDGKIACTSCHDATSPHPKRVAIAARLCESCHIL
jgi:hypothetical protein